MSRAEMQSLLYDITLQRYLGNGVGRVSHRGFLGVLRTEVTVVTGTRLGGLTEATLGMTTIVEVGDTERAV